MKRLRGGWGRIAVWGLLLLSGGWGCADFEQEGLAFCEGRAQTCAPVIEAATQSAPQSDRQREIVLEVTAMNDGTGPLTFTWQTSLGSVRKEGSSETHSRVAWVPPLCGWLERAATVSVTVANKYSQTVKTFNVVSASCESLSLGLMPPVFPPPTVPAVTSGRGHTLALLANGRIRAWGTGNAGQLGIGAGATNGRAFAELVSSLRDVASVASGEFHSLALLRDGTVWAWGDNQSGQLGAVSSPEINFPVRVDGVEQAVALAAGGQHSLALLKNGSVWAWGSKSSGQTGRDPADENRVPRAVNLSSLPPVVAVAAGGSSSMVLCADGSVWTWGSTFHGTPTAPAHTPVQVLGLPAVRALAAGPRHALALGVDGTVWAWGANDQGQLGRDFNLSSTFGPQQIPKLVNVRSIVAGTDFSLALTEEGSVWAWGLNTSGQLGDGTVNNRSAPTKAFTWSGAVRLAAGRSHAAALDAQERLWGWGQEFTTRGPKPVQIPSY